MATAFEDFTLFLAKDLSTPGTSNGPAASELKIEDSDKIKLEYCVPIQFGKRITDNSNAQNIDKSSPDTGTAINQIELLIREDRSEGASDLLEKLMKMYFQKSDTEVFRKGRFGLVNTDNPELDCLPVADGGYKFLGFASVPHIDNPSTQLYRVKLDFIGDHTILGAFQ